MAPRLTGVEPLTGPDLFALPVLALVLLSIPTFAMIRYCRERQACRHKLDAELTVGREINLLLRDGFYVFHDVPEGSGNVDHVVVGLSGVFAVESVGRPVPDLGRGFIDAKVIYDGENLFFPPKNVRESEAVKQSRRQAIAMERWLGDALGWSVQVDRPWLCRAGLWKESGPTIWFCSMGRSIITPGFSGDRRCLLRNRLRRLSWSWGPSAGASIQPSWPLKG